MNDFVKRDFAIFGILLLFIILFAWYLFAHTKTFFKIPLNRVATCFHEGNSPCLYGIATDALAHNELQEILNALGDYERKPTQDFLLSCHTFTHYLGRVAYAGSGSIAEVFHQCSEVCEGGCYHGVVEGYLSSQEGVDYSNTAKFFGEIKKTCGDRNEYAVSELYNQCLHGLGHAIMLVSEGNLPYSLKACDVLKTKSERDYCYAGVFMENNMRAKVNAIHPSQFIKSDDPLYPCTILEPQYLSMCYFLKGQYFHLVTKDWGKAATLCETVPSLYQDQCFFAMGIQQVDVTQNIERMGIGCDSLSPDSFRKLCQYGVVHGLIYRYAHKLSYAISLAQAFCENFKQGDAIGMGCYERIGYELHGWTKNDQELRAYCRSLFPEEHARWCEKGGNKRVSI